MNFSERLRELRDESELSQKEIAAGLGVCISAVSKYESGKNYPDVKKLIRLSEILNISSDYLLGLSDVMIPLYSTKTTPYILNLPFHATKEQYKVIRKISASVLRSEIKAIKTESFAERLKRLRLENEMSKKELAIEFKVTISAISEYETKKNFPDVKKVMKMAKNFDVSVDYLLGLSDSSFPLHSTKISPYELILPFGTSPEQYRLIQRIAQNILKVEFTPENTENS
jgi:transcriptional regulator with XRE-family HTH domain